MAFAKSFLNSFFPSAKENAAKQEPHQRAAVKNLSEKRHWEIADDGAEPLIDKIQADAMENEGCPKTHSRTHEAYGNAGAHQYHQNGFVLPRRYQTKHQLLGNFIHNKVTGSKAQWQHEPHLPKHNGKNSPCPFPHLYGAIIKLHAQHHKK